jgi:hypothetical protein
MITNNILTAKLAELPYTKVITITDNKELRFTVQKCLTSRWRKQDFETTYIDLKTEAGIAKFKVLSKIIDEWYNDYLDEALFIFAKK